MEQIKTRIREKLSDEKLSALYANTFYSLLDRMDEDGFFPESVAGGYGRVVFCCTMGGMNAFLQSIGDYEREERMLNWILESSKRCGLTRIPHIAFYPEVDEDGNITQRFSNDDQIDTTLCSLHAYAELVNSGHATPAFEEKWYDYITDLLHIVFDQPYFYYNDQQPIDLYPLMFPPENMKLLFNCALEHSREGRRWSAFDIYSNCYGGATLRAMAKVAKRRGDEKNARFWEEREALLREGINQHLVAEENGKRVYLEMLLPDGGWGKPFHAKSMLMMYPQVLDWEPAEHEVLINTVERMRQTLYIEAPLTNGLHFMAEHYDEDGTITMDAVGKNIAWQIEYSLNHGEWDLILEALEFLEAVQTAPLMSENLRYTKGKWVQCDPGNADQCSWWCKVFKRLREEVGLPGIPSREDCSAYTDEDINAPMWSDT